MVKGPYDNYVGGPSWVPSVTIANPGPGTLYLPTQIGGGPDNGPLSIGVKFFDSSATQVNEDDSIGTAEDTATIPADHSFTFKPLALNGTVNDDQQGSVTSCTAFLSSGY
jgi:hypothetical protein